MILITEDIRRRLLANGMRQAPVRGTEAELDLEPVVKLFTPDAGATWLLTELDPDEPDIAWGLCDLGLGFPELGPVRLSELEAIRGALGMRVERDRHFVATKTIGAYADVAIRAGQLSA